MTMFNMVRDINGYNSFLRKQAPTADKYSTTLALGVVQTVIIPTTFEKCVVIFGYEVGSTVWVAVNGTAARAGISFSTTTSELNPVGYQVNGGDTVSFVTPDTNAQIGVSIYALQQ